jgi:transposase
MDNKIATYMQEEDMELTVEDTYASVDVEMLGTEESEGRHMPSFPSTNTININETAEQPFEHLRTFMDIDPADTNDKGIQAESRSLVKSALQENGPKIKMKSKPRGSYRKYTADQVEKLFDLVIEEGRTAKEAALITGINIRTAQHYVKKYNDDEERRLPFGHRKPRVGHVGKLTDAHSEFLMDYIDKYPTSVLADIRQKLCETFQGLSITVSALHRHLVQKCMVTLKKLEKLPAARNTDRVIKLRKERVEEWEMIQDLDFTKNCVFIDEAGFNLHTQRNFGRSLKGTPAKGTIPTGRGVTVSILGAISDAGVIDISLKKPQAAAMSKKRKGNGRAVAVVNGRIGTRTEHYLAYLSNVMDVLDRNNMKGHYLVMDNAPIHTPATVRALIESRGYKCLYLPPYSPFLNPIEEFWAKVKAGIRRNALRAEDRLSDRICESVNKVTRSDCEAWIRHATSFFPRCKNEERDL